MKLTSIINEAQQRGAFRFIPNPIQQEIFVTPRPGQNLRSLETMNRKYLPDTPKSKIDIGPLTGPMGNGGPEKGLSVASAKGDKRSIGGSRVHSLADYLEKQGWEDLT